MTTTIPRRRIDTTVVAAALCIAMLSSCASGAALRQARRALEGGDPVGAVLSAAESVRADPRNEDAILLLSAIYQDTIDRRLADADAAEASDAPYRWEAVAAALGDVHAMSDAVRALPPLVAGKPKAPVTFGTTYRNDRLAAALLAAAERRYADGVDQAAVGTRPSWRDAYRSFTRALELSPGFRDAEKRAAEAADLGSARILVLPFDSIAGDALADPFSRVLYERYAEEAVAVAASREFLRVVDRSLIERMLAEHELSSGMLADGRVKPEALGIAGADVIVYGRLVELVPSYPSITSRSLDLEATVDEPIPGALPVNGVVPTWKVTVRAAVTVFEKRSSVRASVSIRAVDVGTSDILSARTFTETASDEHQWAVFTGDRRALVQPYAALVDVPERAVRMPDAMLVDLAGRIAKTAAAELATLLP